MEILRIYSLILVSFEMILNLINILRKDNKNDRIAAFIAVTLYVPLWIYLLKI